MTHLSLFSGIGGIDLAAEWAGFETVAFVEQNPFCQKVLAKNFPGIPIHDDIKRFDAESFRGTLDLISGGFPCQDISYANPFGKGLEGDRSGLWFEMLRVIEQARPAWVLVENVRNLISMGIDTCFLGMEALGYEVTALVVPACGAGAIHRRERVFIVAHSNDSMRQGRDRVEEPHADRGRRVCIGLDLFACVHEFLPRTLAGAILALLVFRDALLYLRFEYVPVQPCASKENAIHGQTIPDKERGPTLFRPAP